MSTFITVAIVHFLAVMSPGPDFILVSRISIANGKPAGLFTALGIGLGMLVHVTYSLLGIGFVIAQSIVLYSTIKYLGAAYLLYIGWKALCSHANPSTADVRQHMANVSLWKFFWSGFLCNALNPKATLFFLALFTQIIEPSTAVSVQILYGMYLSTATFAWFSAVVLMLNCKPIKNAFSSIHHILDRCMGTLLIALGIKVALSSRE